MLLLAAIVVFAGIVFFAVQLNAEKGKNLDERLLAIAEKNEFVKGLIVGQRFEAKITELSAEKILELKENDAAYKNLPEKTLYQINYSSAQKGNYVAIIDLEKEEAIKFYRIASISMGAG